MIHDDKCELRDGPQMTPFGLRAPSCQCGSRAFPLCDGCRSSQHLKHVDMVLSRNLPCCCDLCYVEVGV